MAKFRGAVLACKNCGGIFQVPPSRAKEAKYCSTECAYEHWRKTKERQHKVTKTCLQCGKEFETWPAWEKKGSGKYCSRDCYRDSKRKQETRICAYCGDPFSIKKSASDICCSWECRVARSKTEEWPTWKKQLRQCEQCGKEFWIKRSEILHGRGHFCSKKCHYESRTIVGIPVPAFYTGAEWRTIRDKILERDEHKCQSCGFSGKGLHIHHVELKRDGGNEDESNLITLCNSCHMKLHWANGSMRA